MRSSAVIAIVCATLLGATLLAQAENTVDLNAPGALTALERSNPAHYRKVTRILEEVSRRPVEDVPKWLTATYDAWDVRYTPLLLISNPPKRDLSFVLEDTRYEVRVTLTSGTYRSIPLVR